MENNKRSFFDEVGGSETLKKVHKIFYDKIYAHPWIGQFFAGIDQQVIEDQQSDFMAQNFGGPARYLGKLPQAAHKHMFLNEELFTLRKNLLEESLIEVKLAPAMIEKWLKIDAAFKSGIVKKSIDDCEKRYFTDHILSFTDPNKKKNVA